MYMGKSRTCQVSKRCGKDFETVAELEVHRVECMKAKLQREKNKLRAMRGHQD